jgi:hypothetical protein
MTLTCIAFKLGPLSVSRSRSQRVFRAQTTALGIVEIGTEDDLSQLDTLYLVRPWILLDRRPVGSVIETIPEEKINDQSSSIGVLPSKSFPGPSDITSVAPRTRTAWLVARLVRPFWGRPPTRPQDAAFSRPLRLYRRRTNRRELSESSLD